MKSFSFAGLRPIIFDVDGIHRLPDEIVALNGNASRVFVVSDTGLAKTGTFGRVLKALEQSGLKATVFSNLSGEPHAGVVDEAAGILRRLDRPCVVGIGGGSVLDVAKLAAAVAEAETATEAYALCAKPLPTPGLKRILLPTTAGTGSEVTRTAVFFDRRGRKVWAWGEALLPDMVILDPSLTLSLPAGATAMTGLDALVHAIEAFTCRQNNPVSDALALHAIRFIGQFLPAVMENPVDIDARSHMLIASTLAGSAFAQTGTAGAHAIGHALATLAGIPHGRAVAIGMDALLPFNAEIAPQTHAAVAEALGMKKTADGAGKAFRRLVKLAGLDPSLADAGIQPQTLAEAMMSEENLPMIENNIRPIGAEEALAISRRILA